MQGRKKTGICHHSLNAERVTVVRRQKATWEDVLEKILHKEGTEVLQDLLHRLSKNGVLTISIFSPHYTSGAAVFLNDYFDTEKSLNKDISKLKNIQYQVAYYPPTSENFNLKHCNK